MYYFLYGLFYLLSLLPFRVIYWISDGLTVLVYHVLGYRKAVVMSNLQRAFPDKTEAERKAIAKEFYRNFIDTLLETLKMLSMTDAEFAKRCTIDQATCNAIAEAGNNIQFHGTHQMNWEYANWVFARNLTVPLVGMYMPISNKAIDRIFRGFRLRYKTILVSTGEFKSRMHQVFKSQYAMAMAPDQNAASTMHAFWLNFFGKEAPFATAPDKMAIRNKAAVVFVEIEKRKRGYYHFNCIVATPNAADLKPGMLTLQYRDFLEAAIRRQPSNYLWTHKRWKHGYEKQFEKRWIDTAKPPL